MEAKADAAAHLAVAAEDVPLAMAVCIVEAPPKDVPSRHGMRRSAENGFLKHSIGNEARQRCAWPR